MGMSSICNLCKDQEQEENLKKNNNNNELSISNKRDLSLMDKPITQLRSNNNANRPFHFSLVGASSSTILDDFGIITWDNKSFFKGYFKNKLPNGWGVYYHPTNGTFQGIYRDDQPNGYGIFTHITESNYEGYWKNEKQDGIGIERWPDGAIYIGEFIQGKKGGIGQYIFPNQNIYYGEWEQNLMNGFGLYSYRKDQIYIGEWLNGLRDGYGEIYGTNDNYFFGFFRNNVQNGFFIYYNSKSGKIIVGNNLNGKIDGIAKYFMPNCEGKMLLVKNGHKIKEINDIDEMDYIKDDRNIRKGSPFRLPKNKYFYMNRNELEEILRKKINNEDKRELSYLLEKNNMYFSE